MCCRALPSSLLSSSSLPCHPPCLPCCLPPPLPHLPPCLPCLWNDKSTARRARRLPSSRRLIILVPITLLGVMVVSASVHGVKHSCRWIGAQVCLGPIPPRDLLYLLGRGAPAMTPPVLVFFRSTWGIVHTSQDCRLL